MTQPVSYVPAVGFQAEETAAVAGRSTVRTSALDAELQAVSLTLSQILTNLAVIQRDDTGLRDLVVTTQSLSANVKALFSGGINPRGTWLTATAYAVKDVVETLTPLVSYICVVAHTSGVFATDRSAGKWMVLGQEPGSTVITDLTLTTGGITLGTNNTQDLAATANRFRSGYFGTSVVTPMVSTGGALILQNTADAQMSFQINSATKWAIIATSFALVPGSDNTINLGSPGLRIANVFTPIIDSGTTGSLSLRTNNGTTVATFANSLLTTLAGSLTVTGGDVGTGVGGSLFLSTSGGQQFEATHTAGVTRHITVAGSNGGNPTISTTAGSLNLGVASIVTSASALALSVGANGATNPVLSVDASAASVVNGIQIQGTASGGSPAIRAISSDANANIVVLPRGTGLVVLGNVSTTDTRFARTLVALGGGAAPTLGTIAGSGPVAAAQNSWMRFIANDDLPFWVPVWR